MDPSLASAFRPYLMTDEHVLWTGRPQQGIRLSGRDTYLIPFSLMWGGFALFWNVSVWTIPDGGRGPDLFFRLWGLPFLIAGLYIIVGRFIHDAAIRHRLIYAVTDERVLTLRGARIISLDIRHLPRLELSEHRNGTGTITFEDGPMWMGRGMNGFGWWVPSLSRSMQFIGIDQPRSVYELIRKQART